MVDGTRSQEDRAEEIEVDFDAIDRLKAEAAATPPPKDEIEIVNDEAAPVEPVKQVVSPDAGLVTLKKQLDDEKNARIAAEQNAAQSAEAERQALTQVQSTRLDVIKTGIDTATQNKSIFKTELAAAMAAADYERAAEIQEKMADNSANLLYLNQHKEQLERAPKPALRAPADPVEVFAAKLSPISASWVRSHPEFVRDKMKNRQMLAADELAQGRGFAADSPEYFKDIERTLNISQPEIRHTNGDATLVEDATADAAATPVAARRGAPPAAPPSRSGAGAGASSRPNVVRLTAAQREAAQISGMTDQEYAKQVLVIEREKGKLN